MEFKVIREKLSSRGGGIEIDLTPFGFDGERMTAYQNYLGGGMLGSINNACTMSDKWRTSATLQEIAINLRKHFAELMGIDYEEHNSRPFSSY